MRGAVCAIGSAAAASGLLRAGGMLASLQVLWRLADVRERPANASSGPPGQNNSPLHGTWHADLPRDSGA
jgi:hypothetical protein